MKFLIFILFLIYPFFSYGAFQIKPGDIILVPMNCYSCRLIEKTTHSIYSHSAIVLEVKQDRIIVAHSVSRITTLPLKQFLKLKDPLREAKVLRNIELKKIEDHVISQKLKKYYESKFKGLPFDHFFKWDNFEGEKELLYCSEFITKILNSILIDKIKPVPMDYSEYWDHWLFYFNQNIPQGELGNSPAFFERSSLFFTVGYL